MPHSRRRRDHPGADRVRRRDPGCPRSAQRRRERVRRRRSGNAAPARPRRFDRAAQRGARRAPGAKRASVPRAARSGRRPDPRQRQRRQAHRRERRGNRTALVLHRGASRHACAGPARPGKPRRAAGAPPATARLRRVARRADLPPPGRHRHRDRVLEPGARRRARSQHAARHQPAQAQRGTAPVEPRAAACNRPDAAGDLGARARSGGDHGGDRRAGPAPRGR